MFNISIKWWKGLDIFLWNGIIESSTIHLYCWFLQELRQTWLYVGFEQILVCMSIGKISPTNRGHIRISSKICNICEEGSLLAIILRMQLTTLPGSKGPNP